MAYTDQQVFEQLLVARDALVDAIALEPNRPIELEIRGRIRKIMPSIEALQNIKRLLKEYEAMANTSGAARNHVRIKRKW